MIRGQHKRWTLLVFMALFGSLVEIAAAVLIYVLLGLVADPSGAIQLPIIGDIRELAGGMGERTLLFTLVGIMIGFFVIRAGIVLGTEYLIARVANNASARLSAKLAKGYLDMPYSFHLQHSSSELIRNSHQAPIDIVTTIFVPVIRLIAETLLTVGMLALLMVMSPVGTGLAIAVVGGATMILMLVIQPRLKKFGAETWRLNSDTLSSLQQSYQGVKDIKLLGKTAFFAEAYWRSRRRLGRMMYLRETLFQSPFLVIQTSLILFILIFFAIELTSDSVSTGTISILGVFAYAGMRLQPSLRQIAGSFNSLKFSTAPTSDLCHDLDAIERNQSESEEVEPMPFRVDIRLEGVSFEYEGSETEVLTGVDLTISRGEQIGVCGPTGGGKTTLVDLVTGLLAPTKGRILVDGVDIESNRPGWQQNLGMTPQAVFLIDDSLRRNIALGVEDSDVDEYALAAAVRLAQLDDFVAGLPSGLDTGVGERGVRISGGERQRIAVARALYRRPQVLIFDEGTSALDNTTEEALMRAVKALRGDRTVVLVAHRLSTLRDADRVIFVESGRLSGVDTFDRLLRDNDAFKKMVEAGRNRQG